MKKVVENIKFIQDGTMVFGDLHLKDGFVERIDYKTPHMTSNIAIPGFVDLHTHGFRGFRCEEKDIQKLQQLAQAYPKRGVTTFCPTLHAMTLKEYANYLDVYRVAFKGQTNGATYGGAYLEGPYLHPACCGAMDPKSFQTIDIGELDDFLKEYHDDIRMMTVAPDVEHAMEAIRLLRLYGVNVALGHTAATYDEVNQAFDNGATLITHLCNTMPAFNHHKETMMDAVLLSDCQCEIIMDGKHIQYKMLDWLLKLLGTKRVIAISDGSMTSGLTKEERSMMLNEEDKTERAIGNHCDLLDIFRYLYERYDFMDCISMCSLNAGKLLRNYSCEIGLGKKVDLVVLDYELEVLDVIIDGRSVL